MLSVIWKSDLTDKIKRSFFQAAVVSILLYGYTTWTLTKHMEKNLDSNYKRMPSAILDKSWRQHPIKQQLYGHLLPITKTIQVRWTKHTGHCWRRKAEIIRDVFLWPPSHGRTSSLNLYTSSVPIEDGALKTSRDQWTIEMGSERGSGRTM